MRLILRHHETELSADDGSPSVGADNQTRVPLSPVAILLEFDGGWLPGADGNVLDAAQHACPFGDGRLAESSAHRRMSSAKCTGSDRMDCAHVVRRRLGLLCRLVFVVVNRAGCKD